jgi:hypothetical protein
MDQQSNVFYGGCEFSAVTGRGCVIGCVSVAGWSQCQCVDIIPAAACA